MTQDKDDFMNVIRTLQDDQPPAGLYERIMTVAPHMPQLADETPVQKQRSLWLDPARLLGDWQAAFAFKFAVFAVLAVMGTMVGKADIPQDNNADGVELSLLIDGKFGWEDWT